MSPPRVLETCLYAENLDETARFYAEIVGLELVRSEGDRHRFFRTTGGMVFLFNPLETPIPPPEGALPKIGVMLAFALSLGLARVVLKSPLVMKLWRP